MNQRDDIVAELLETGRELWSRVECDVKRDRLVIYARLSATPNLQQALEESERVLAAVLERRLVGQNWVAAVQWSERLCRTIEPAVTVSSAAHEPEALAYSPAR
jgi:hypothetical protein